MVRWSAVSALALWAGCVSFADDTLFACGDDGSCPPGLVCQAGLCSPARPDAGGDDGFDGGASDAGGDGDGGVLPGCVDGVGPDASGVYVDLDEVTKGSGQPADPFSSLTRALGAGAVVYLTGAGASFDTLRLGDAGVRIEGAWSRDGGAWVKDCRLSARPRLAFSQSVGLRVVAGGPVVLRDLLVAQAEHPAGGPDAGGSFAVWVDDGADVTLERVDVVSGYGDSPTIPGDVARENSDRCSKATDCSDGGVGSAGGPGEASDGGVFTRAGFSPGEGRGGERGTWGEHGVATNVTLAQCADRCESTVPPCGDSLPAPTRVPLPPSFCGCGGNGGPGGVGGHGGHASVGLLVVGAAAAVRLEASTVRCLGGGAGTPGGAGAAGGDGTEGRSGAVVACVPAGKPCVAGTRDGGASCSLPQAVTAQSPAGGRGGPGGIGGPGGAGAGGPCHALVTVGRPAVTVEDGTQLVAGPGGSGPVVNGASTPRLDVD